MPRQALVAATLAVGPEGGENKEGGGDKALDGETKGDVSSVKLCEKMASLFMHLRLHYVLYILYTL